MLERVKKQIKVEADKQMVTMEALKDSEVISELESLHAKGIELVEPSDMAGSIRGKSGVYDQMELLIKTAEESIIIMTTEAGLLSKIDAFRKPLQKAHERGATIRIIAPKTALTVEKAKELADIADIRFSDEIKARFIIADNKEIVFMLMDDVDVHPSYEVGVWLNTPFFTAALAALFDTTFKNLKAVTVKH